MVEEYEKLYLEVIGERMRDQGLRRP